METATRLSLSGQSQKKEEPPAGPTALQLKMSPQVGMTHFPFTFILVRRGQKS